MKSLIPNVKAEAISNKWMNKKGAEFQYNEIELWYKLIELTSDGRTYLINPSERNNVNCPVIVLGFVAYLIHNWGKFETEIYNGFYELCLSDFLNKEERLPGAFKRDLKAEYYKLHIEEESARVAYSRNIYPYLTDNDIELISRYTESYFDFIKIEYDKRPIKAYKKQFPEYFDRSNESLSGICKRLFNNNSPKDYAIMLCLLSENGLVTIANKQRKTFFSAWYNFIGKQLPKRENYNAINKFIVDKAASGFVFKDEEDPDYCNKKLLFDKALKSNEI